MELCIETTRRCNMACEHCMRGETQKIDFNVTHLQNFIVDYNVRNIGTITLTGGEPTLVPEVMMNILGVLKDYTVEVNDFFVATNGKRIPDEFILAALKYYDYCSSNDATGIAVSNGDWYNVEERPGRHKLDALTFVSNKAYLRATDARELLNQGRAKWIAEREPEICPSMVYLNCLGESMHACDLSYENQRQHKVYWSNEEAEVPKEIWEEMEKVNVLELEDVA